MSYYHLSGAMLANGSIVEPGNWGRVIRAWGWQHTLAMRECALEDSRIARFSHRPSRLESAFVLPSLDEAKFFRNQTNGFQQHILYRVSLCDDGASSHITDSRLCSPQGTLRPNWADIYWLDLEQQASAIPGINWLEVVNGVQLRELLTLSKLRIEERITE